MHSLQPARAPGDAAACRRSRRVLCARDPSSPDSLRAWRSAALLLVISVAPASRPLAILRTSMRLGQLARPAAAAAAPAGQRWVSTATAHRAPSSSSAAQAPGDGHAGGADESPPLPAPLFLRMPPIEGVGKCLLQRWCVPVGQSFRQGDVLAEIDSDLAVIEYKAQDDGIMALHRAHEGDKILEGQILAVQVGSAGEIPAALPWLHHVEKLARRERREIDRLHAQEEAEAEAIAQVEREAVAASQAASDAVDAANDNNSTRRR